MEGYYQNLHINDSAFEKMRADADRVLQRLIKNMVEKDSLDGKVTITIDVSLTQEFIPNRDPNIQGETRRVLMPKLSHKVGSVMQIKNETKGDTNYDEMELVYDEESGEYVLRPIANTEQMTIFDADFQCVSDPEEIPRQSALKGRCVAAITGPVEGCSDGNEEDDEPGDEGDISEESDGETPLPFEGSDDEYGYEEPGEEF